MTVIAIPQGQGQGLNHEHPQWIYSAQVNDTDVIVYRTVLMSDDDSEYRQIVERLDGYREVSRQTVPDNSMMFGQADLIIFRKA
jgi:hypothetical protein